MLSIGFVLLTHANERQALRLVRTLNLLFDHPPIACHHDFSQAAFDPSHFSENVRFVQPNVRTSWGTISLVKATLLGLRLLYRDNSPDWFYLISGSDYPIRSAESIREELAASHYDAYARLKRIDHTRIPPDGLRDTGGLDSPTYTRLAYQRYIARSLPIPSPKHPWRGPAATHLRLMNPTLLRPFHPFTEDFHCYTGDQWFAGNSRAAAELLDASHERLLKYFTGRFPPDEAFCPTVLGNARDLKVCTESKHFIKWEAGNHPKNLTESALPAMLASSAHFARKFQSDSPVLDEIDKSLGISAVVGAY